MSGLDESVEEESGEKILSCVPVTAFTGATGSSRVGTGKSVNPVGIPPTNYSVFRRHTTDVFLGIISL